MRQRASVRLRLRSQVWAASVLTLGGKSVRQTLVELSHVFRDALLIAFDREEVIGTSFLHDNPRRFRLRIQGVGGDQGTLELDPAEQFLDGGNLIGTLGPRFRAERSAPPRRLRARDPQ